MLLSQSALVQADINQSADEFEAQLLAQRRENEVCVSSAFVPASINVMAVVQQPLPCLQDSQLHIMLTYTRPHRGQMWYVGRLHRSQLDVTP